MNIVRAKVETVAAASALLSANSDGAKSKTLPDMVKASVSVGRSGDEGLARNLTAP